jgi:hypothetical protein
MTMPVDPDGAATHTASPGPGSSGFAGPYRLGKTGRRQEARPLLEAAFEIRIRELPPTHRDRKDTAADYAQLLETMGLTAEASAARARGAEAGK